MPVGSQPTELVRPGRTYPLRRKDSLEGRMRGEEGGGRKEGGREGGRKEGRGREEGRGKKGGRKEEGRVITIFFFYKPATPSPRVMFCCCSTIVYCWTSPL